MEARERDKRRARGYLAFAARAGAGIAIVAFILARFDARKVLATLAHERLACFALAVAIYVGGQVMSAYRWQLLAAALDLKARYSEFLAYYFVGMFTNLFVPGLVGGDAARALYLGRKNDRLGDAIASVVADRGFGLIALFWLAGFAALAMNRGTLPRSVTTPTISVAAIALLAVVASQQIVKLIAILPRPLHRLAAFFVPYLRHPATTVAPLVLSLVLQFSMAVIQFILARGLGMSASLTIFILVVPIANVVASLPVTLNGLGVREASYIVLFGMAGIGKNEAVALGLLWFAATMIGGLTGAIAFAMTPTPAIRSPEAP